MREMIVLLIASRILAARARDLFLELHPPILVCRESADDD